MNSPEDRKRLAAVKQAHRLRRIRTIRQCVAAIGVSLAITFSALVVQRDSGGSSATASTSVESSPTTAVVIDPSTDGQFASESQATTAAQPEPLTTSQS